MKSIEVYTGGDTNLSKLVQQHAFRLGYYWEIDFGKPMFTSSPRLYFTSNGFIYRNVPTTNQSERFIHMTPMEFLELNKCKVNSCDCPCHK